MQMDSMTDVCRRRVKAVVRDSGVPGVAVAAFLDGQRLLDVGIGHADLRGARSLDARLRQPLYSISKLVLATAVMRLVERRELQLDNRAVELVPRYPLDPAITLEHLLRHTSGLPDYGPLPEYGADVRSAPDRPWSEDAFFERTMRQGMRFPPGGGWAYSNLGYMLVRLIVERATGQSLRDVLHDLVFAPLGLAGTCVVATVDDLANLAPGYSRQLDEDGELQLVNGRYHPGWVAHGLVASTAADTAAMLDALFGGRLHLGRQSLERMLVAVPVPAEHPWIVRPGYGIGLMVDRGSEKGVVAGHAGGGPGFATAAFHFSSIHGHRLTVAALANSDAGDAGTRVAFAVADVVSEVLARRSAADA